MRKAFSALYALIGIIPFASAIDAEDAKAKARQYCSQLGVPFEISRSLARPMGLQHDRRWMVTFGETFIVLADDDGRLLLIEDSERANKLRRSNTQSPSLAIENDAEAWNKSRQLLGRLSQLPQFEPRSINRFGWGSNVNENRRGKSIAWFEVRPYAFGTFGNGNKAIVTLDTQTADLVSLELETRWTYVAPPVDRIGAQAANNIARPLVGDARRTEIGYFTPNGGFGSLIGRSLLAQRKALLAYCVTSDQGSVIVESSGGTILGGGRVSGKSSASNQKPNALGQVPTSGPDLSIAAVEKVKLVSAFGYGHIPASKIAAVKRGKLQLYYFTESHETSEIQMCKFWPRFSWPYFASFRPAKDGPKLARPVTDKKSALPILSKVVKAINGRELRIESVKMGKLRFGGGRYKNAVLATVVGSFKLKDGKTIAFGAEIIPSSGRFLSWGADERQ